MQRRSRLPAIPELFFGLVAIVWTAHIFAATVHDARHVHTIVVTGSAKRPISANLVEWSLTVRGEAARATGAARRLRRETAAAHAYLSTELTQPKLDALEAATAEARRRAET